jgi:hypothetical protein
MLVPWTRGVGNGNAGTLATAALQAVHVPASKQLSMELNRFSGLR